MLKLLPVFALLLGACDASDVDGDGFDAPEDCDDNAANINPDAIDVRGNGLDEDCNGVDRPQFPYVGEWTGVGTSRNDVEIDLVLDLRANLTVTANTDVAYDEVIAFDGSGNIRPDDGDDDLFDFEISGTIVFPDFGAAPSTLDCQCRIQSSNTLICGGIVYSESVPWWRGEVFDYVLLRPVE